MKQCSHPHGSNWDQHQVDAAHPTVITGTATTGNLNNGDTIAVNSTTVTIRLNCFCWINHWDFRAHRLPALHPVFLEFGQTISGTNVTSGHHNHRTWVLASGNTGTYTISAAQSETSEAMIGTPILR